MLLKEHIKANKQSSESDETVDNNSSIDDIPL